MNSLLVTKIPLDRRGRKFALIDTENDLSLRGWTWHFSSSYASNNYLGLMHRVILEVSNPNVFVDHINGDTLDNRKQNLRIATHQENQRNSKGRNRYNYKGVTLRPSGRWGAYINDGRKHLWLGTFNTEEEAAQAYDVNAIKHFGEFARLNFPKEEATGVFVTRGQLVKAWDTHVGNIWKRADKSRFFNMMAKALGFPEEKE